MVSPMKQAKNIKQNYSKTHFGFKDINTSEKTSLVRDVFNSVAPSYDLMNDLMSGGVHRLWKNVLIDRLKPQRNMHLIDVGGGTGDLTFKFLQNGGKNVVIVDINEEMLKFGRDRALNRGIIKNPIWINGNAEQLPLEDASFDAYITAFCLRNVTHLDQALREAYRLLKPGGHFLCLEFSKVILPALSELYDTYSFKILPLIGQIVAKDRDSYQYLAESIRRFPPQDAFASLIAQAGLEQISYQNLSGGIVAIHSAWKI